MSRAFAFSFKTFSLLSMLLGLPSALGTQALWGQVQPRVLRAVEETAAVTLKGTAPTLSRSARDQGAAPDSLTSHMMLMLRRSPDQDRELEHLIQQQQDPKSAQYHHWLSPEEFGKRFGVADSDVQAVTGYLQSHGFQVGRVFSNKSAIEISGTAGQLRSTFHTEVHQFSTKGKTFYANVGDAQVPAALAPVVSGFGSSQKLNYTPEAQSIRASFDSVTHRAHPFATATPNSSLGGGLFAVAPGDLHTIYDIPAPNAAQPDGTLLGAGGQGVTIGVVGDSNINLATINNYQNTFALPQTAPTVIVDGNDPGVTADAVIAYKQIELINAVAPNAAVNYYVSASVSADPNLNYDSGINFALLRAMDDNAVQVLLIGYQACESNLGASNAFISSVLRQATAQGITVVAATGNSGASACDAPGDTGSATGTAVNAYASSPYVTAVGGTDFYYNGNPNTYWAATNSNFASAKGYIPEQVWNDSNPGGSQANLNPSNPAFLAGGGGISTLGSSTYPNGLDGAPVIGPYPMPAYQLGVASGSLPTSSGSTTTTSRVIPDISFFAGSGPGFTEGANNTAYLFCIADSDCAGGTTPAFTLSGGTEASSAVFAGAMALVLEYNFKSANYRLGNANPTLYNYASTFSPGTITNGQASTVYYHDVTLGSNTMPCSSNCPVGGFAAGPNFDAATGIGSLDISNLITHWIAPNTTGSSIIFTMTNASTGKPLTTIQHSKPVAFSATVQSTTQLRTTPTGDIGFYSTNPLPAQSGIEALSLPTGTLPTGSNTVTEPGNYYLPGGTYQIYARYSGDQKYAASISAPQTLIVTPESSKLDVIAGMHNVYYSGDNTGAKTVPFGSPVVITVGPFSLTGGYYAVGVPTGSISVADNGATIATLPINSEGTATFNSNHLSLNTGTATHSLVFTYSGDASFQASSTKPFVFSVAQAPTTTTIYSSDGTNHASFGNPPNTFTVVVAGQAVTSNGTLLLENGAAPTGTVTLTGQYRRNNGAVATESATVALTSTYDAQGNSIAVGTVQPQQSGLPETYTAIYAGNSNFASSTSNTVTIGNLDNDGTGTTSIRFTNLPFSIGITQNLSVGISVTYQNGFGATLNAAQGSLTLFANGVSLGSQNVTGQTVNFPISKTNGYLNLPSGSVTFTANYSTQKSDPQFGDPSCFLFVFCPLNASDKSITTTLNVIDDRTSADFSLQSDVAVNAGYKSTQMPLSPTNGSAIYNLQLTSIYNFSGTTPVALTCSVLNQPGLQCSLGAGSLTLGSAGITGTTLTVSAAPGFTIAQGGTQTLPASRWWIAGGSTALACIFLCGLPGRRRHWQSILGAFIAVCVSLGATGCSMNMAKGFSTQAAAGVGPTGGTGNATGTAGGTTGGIGTTGTSGGNSINGSNGATPAAATKVLAGNYTVIVTATATPTGGVKIIHNLPLQVIVQ